MTSLGSGRTSISDTSCHCVKVIRPEQHATIRERVGPDVELSLGSATSLRRTSKSMSGPISRDDAVLAARLWGLASRRYFTTSVVPLRSPEPASLYAGFAAAGLDPVDALTDLVAELGKLAATWEAWRRETPVDCIDLRAMVTRLP